MCGIIGYAGKNGHQNILLEGLERLEYRGYDSAGIAVMQDKKVKLIRAKGRISRLRNKVKQQQLTGDIGIGHTRWATHGAATERNAHPHQAGLVTLVHNGIIENYQTLKKRILDQGRRVQSDTDTEIVAHLFDEELQKGLTLEEASGKVLPELRGSYAFVIMNANEPDTLLGVRNGAPLLVGIGEKQNYLASDVQAILHRTKRVIYLEDKQLALCHRDGVQLKDLNGKPANPSIKVIDWSPEEMDKMGYRHYMLKEIHEQPHALANTMDGSISSGRISLSQLSAPLLRRFNRAIIIACGTSKHAAHVGAHYLETFARIPVEVDFASEFRYRTPVFDRKTLLIFISQSGETADTLAALRAARTNDGNTLCISNVPDSSLVRESEFPLYTKAGPEIGVASTKAFTTQLLVMYMLAVQMGEAKGQLTRKAAKQLTEGLAKLPLLTEQVLDLQPDIEEVAARYRDDNFFFYLGRGINYPVALEGALKLKEITYRHAEGFPSGELKHGPIALVDPMTTTVVLAPRQKNTGMEQTLFEKILSNVQEVKARGGKICGIGTQGDSDFSQHCDTFIGLPPIEALLSPITLALPVQLFAYHVAILLGTDVDKPRNLAKSVTVE